MNNKETSALVIKTVSFFFLVFLCTLGFLFIQNRFFGERKNNSAFLKQNHNNYLDSLTRDKPETLRNALVSDIQANVNDQFTKSDAYFVTHRFFDNNENIQEVYDYITSVESLAFLNEASSIYPRIFKDLSERKKLNRADKYRAYLAYVEVLENHGYTDIAGLATSANQYARLAKNDLDAGMKISDEVYKTDIAKSLAFAEKTKEQVVGVFSGAITKDTVPPRDILVGLNQYGSALRHYQLLGVLGKSFVSPISAKECFDRSTEYAVLYVPEQKRYTAFVNASTLAMIDKNSAAQMSAILKPILSYKFEEGKPVASSVIRKILNARDVRSSDTSLKNNYDKTNIVAMALASSEFKAWLLAHGWQEQDFK